MIQDPTHPGELSPFATNSLTPPNPLEQQRALGGIDLTAHSLEELQQMLAELPPEQHVLLRLSDRLRADGTVSGSTLEIDMADGFSVNGMGGNAWYAKARGNHVSMRVILSGQQAGNRTFYGGGGFLGHADSRVTSLPGSSKVLVVGNPKLIEDKSDHHFISFAKIGADDELPENTNGICIATARVVNKQQLPSILAQIASSHDVAPADLPLFMYGIGQAIESINTAQQTSLALGELAAKTEKLALTTRQFNDAHDEVVDLQGRLDNQSRATGELLKWHIARNKDQETFEGSLVGRVVTFLNKLALSKYTPLMEYQKEERRELRP